MEDLTLPSERGSLKKWVDAWIGLAQMPGQPYPCIDPECRRPAVGAGSRPKSPAARESTPGQGWPAPFFLNFCFCAALHFLRK
jgi:hypothetical protein